MLYIHILLLIRNSAPLGKTTLPFRLGFQAVQEDLADQMGPGENIKIIKNTSIEGITLTTGPVHSTPIKF